jgi:hypothetical protein
MEQFVRRSLTKRVTVSPRYIIIIGTTIIGTIIIGITTTDIGVIAGGATAIGIAGNDCEVSKRGVG